MRITESQLRQIVRQEAQVHELKHGAIGNDPDLDKLVADLEIYAEAVEAMAQDEDEVSDPFVAPRAPRSMRH